MMLLGVNLNGRREADVLRVHELSIERYNERVSAERLKLKMEYNMSNKHMEGYHGLQRQQQKVCTPACCDFWPPVEGGPSNMADFAVLAARLLY